MNSAGRGGWVRALPRDHTLRTIIVCGIAFVLVATACGSTVPEAEQIAAAEATEGLEFSGLPPDAKVNSKGDIVNAQGEVIGTTTSNGPATGAGGTAGSTSVSSGANGPGVTADSIKLGLMTVANADDAAASAGAEVVGSFNYRRAWEAIVEYQNARGGIAGRRIIPAFFTFDAASSRTFSQQQQEQCARWTQDDRVFAGLTWVYSSNILECLQDAGAALVALEGVNTRATTKLHAQYPYYIQPVALTLDRAARAMVEGLFEMGYFSGEEKLGLVTYDDPRFKYAAEMGLVPALRRYGIDLADTAYVHLAESLADYSRLSNDAANAVLRFKSRGIDHVVFIDNGGNAAWQFMLAAERQDYRPRYGFTSNAGNQALADLLGGDARSQLRGALSIGWSPTTDTQPAHDPDGNNPTRVLCFKIMREAGVEYNSPNGKLGALGVCDTLWSLAAALDGYSTVNQSGFLAGMNSLRGGYSPARTWSTYVDRNRHDGVSSVANLRFVPNCTCFRYRSNPYRIP